MEIYAGEASHVILTQHHTPPPKWKDSTDHPQLSCKLSSSVSRPQRELGEEDGRVNSARNELGPCLFPATMLCSTCGLNVSQRRKLKHGAIASVQSKCKRRGLNATPWLMKTSPSPLMGFLGNVRQGLQSTLHHKMVCGPRDWSTGPL